MAIDPPDLIHHLMLYGNSGEKSMKPLYIHTTHTHTQFPTNRTRNSSDLDMASVTDQQTGGTDGRTQRTRAGIAGLEPLQQAGRVELVLARRARPLGQAAVRRDGQDAVADCALAHALEVEGHILAEQRQCVDYRTALFELSHQSIPMKEGERKDGNGWQPES